MATATKKRPSIVQAAGGDGATALNGHSSPTITTGHYVDVANGKGADQVRPILLSQLEPSPTNPRKHFSDEQLDELAASLKQHGLLEPIVVRPDANYVTGKGKPCYEIVCGERRYRAAQRARLKEVLCRVGYFTDAEVLEIQLVENIQRADLTPLEEARAFKNLLDAGMTQEKLAAKIGRTQGHISNRVRLLELPDELQDIVSAGRLPATQARLIAPYAVVPAIVRDMLKFLHEEAREHDGQPPSVDEWQRELRRVVPKHTVAVSGSKWDNDAHKHREWRIRITDENREALQLVPDTCTWKPNSKRAGNRKLVAQLKREMAARKDAAPAQARKAKDDAKRQQREAQAERDRQREQIRVLRKCVVQIAVAKAIREPAKQLPPEFVLRLLIYSGCDRPQCRALFPKLQPWDNSWPSVSKLPDAELPEVAIRLAAGIFAIDTSVEPKNDGLVNWASQQLGVLDVAKAWGVARHHDWLKRRWKDHTERCGTASKEDKLGPPLECPEWLLEKKPAAKKAKGKK